MALIIVESPTKAKTFNRILKGEDYYVFATLGHIRDLPEDRIAINYEKDFKPEYVIIKRKERVVTQLKKLLEKNREVILATDPDREGESIAYHAAYILGFINEKWPELDFKKASQKLKRIVFHEITPNALKEALKKPEDIRFPLVKAQQARRILDRIVGYELSPLLWQKMDKNWLSAGRVQTVALRFVVEREKERETFKKEIYFQIYIDFLTKKSIELRAKLIKKDEIPYEKSFTLKLFDGEYSFVKTSIDKSNVDKIEKELDSDTFIIKDIIENTINRFPPPPFTTSLLQQESINKFGFTSRMVMRLAQDLYEKGLITYHRTDSFSLSTSFVFKAKDYIIEQFGKEYALEKPRGYRTKSRTAQEAHEAIRPTRLTSAPDTIKSEKGFTKNHKLIYELIFNRAIATQMKEAIVQTSKVLVEGKKGYLLETEFQKIMFDGFLRVLNPEYVKRHQAELQVKKNEELKTKTIQNEEKETTPPYRYTEAILIKTLEEKGIGRPSTYSPIISLIQDKGYIEKEGRYFKPAGLGTAISDYLSGAFPNIFDTGFTAQMEEGLDDVAEGKKEALALLKDFYKSFDEHLQKEKLNKVKIKVEEDVKEFCPKCNSPLTVKFSKFGKFYACTAYPKCKFTKPFLKTVEGKKCPLCEGRIVVRYTKSKRRFFGCENYPKCNYISFSYAQLTGNK